MRLNLNAYREMKELMSYRAGIALTWQSGTPYIGSVVLSMDTLR